MLTKTKPATKTLIDVISAGYTGLNRRLWVLIIPIGINVYLWLGSRLSLAPFMSMLHDTVATVASFLSQDPFTQEQLAVSITNADMRIPLAVLNLVPVLPARLLNNTMVENQHITYIHSMSGAVFTIIIINLLALLLSSIFLTVLVSGVRNESCTFADCGGRAMQAALHIFGYLLVIAGLMVLLSLPTVVFMTTFAMLLPEAKTIVLVFFFVLGFWAYLYAGFGIEAIVINEVGPLRAFFRSIRMVRHNLLSAIGLVLITFIIMSGFGIVWNMLSNNLIGGGIAVIGCAYIGSGLSAARLVFYRERSMR